MGAYPSVKCANLYKQVLLVKLDVLQHTCPQQSITPLPSFCTFERPAGDCLRGAPVEKGENEEKNQNFWSRMANSLAIWARVRVPWGSSLPSGKPSKRPSAVAQAMASSA